MNEQKTDKVRECMSKAIELFEELEATVYLQQAKEALVALT